MGAIKVTPHERPIAELLADVERAGCKVRVDGNWVRFDPPPPIDILMELLDRGDEIAAASGGP